MSIIEASGNYLHYEVRGTINRKDLVSYYRQLDRQFAAAGKLNLLVVVHGFRGYTGPLALGTMVLQEHKVFRKAARYAAVTNQRWFARLIGVLNRLVPRLEMAVFTEEEEAKAWLRR